MPNHVYNSMTVTGTAYDIQAFIKQAKHEDRELSYWNFVTPPQEALDSGEYWETHGFRAGEKVGHTPNNWYNFNNREWGTKWDTYDLDVQTAPKAFYATFSSAWSPPLQAFEAMVAQHPHLEFEFRWEEEQGWGGEAVGTRGNFMIGREWDIPTSHSDWEDIGNPEGCVCNWNPEYAYKDCPTQPDNSDTLVLDSTI